MRTDRDGSTSNNTTCNHAVNGKTHCKTAMSQTWTAVVAVSVRRGRRTRLTNENDDRCWFTLYAAGGCYLLPMTYRQGSGSASRHGRLD